jgi:anti-sigma28 factor (negative regulator of flagellin synthesis)
MLSDEIQEMIINGSYRPHNAPIVLPTSTQQIIAKDVSKHEQTAEIHGDQNNTNSFNQTQNTIQNNIVIQYIIDGKLSSNEVIKKLEQHVKHHKHGDEILYGRVEDIRTEIENGSDLYTFSSEKEGDLMMLTDKMTKCLDHKTLTDAYYSFDPETQSYCMRHDEDTSTDRQKWYWQPCTEQKIFAHLVDKMKERVFDDYDTLLCRRYNETPSAIMREKVVGFYKILKYFLIKPKCCSARHDNEILFYSSDDEYGDHTIGFDLSETLNNIYKEAHIDPWQMMNIRNSVIDILQSNAKSAWSIIKDRVIETINLDRDVLMGI